MRSASLNYVLDIPSHHNYLFICDTHARRSAGGITARPRNASRDHHRGVSVKTGASTGLYDDETFATSVLRKYPTSHDPADTEEARVLWEHGYVALDVRASSEIDFEGKVSLF